MSISPTSKPLQWTILSYTLNGPHTTSSPSPGCSDVHFVVGCHSGLRNWRISRPALYSDKCHHCTVCETPLCPLATSRRASHFVSCTQKSAPHHSSCHHPQKDGEISLSSAVDTKKQTGMGNTSLKQYSPCIASTGFHRDARR